MRCSHVKAQALRRDKCLEKVKLGPPVGLVGTPWVDAVAGAGTRDPLAQTASLVLLVLEGLPHTFLVCRDPHGLLQAPPHLLAPLALLQVKVSPHPWLGFRVGTDSLLLCSSLVGLGSLLWDLCLLVPLLLVTGPHQDLLPLSRDPHLQDHSLPVPLAPSVLPFSVLLHICQDPLQVDLPLPLM